MNASTGGKPIRLLRSIWLACAVAVLLTAPGCSVFIRAPKNVEKGKNVICILYNQTEFKDAVVADVTARLQKQGMTVVTGRAKAARHYSSADFAAVVHMSDYWMHHVPYHAVRYFKRNKESRNTLFVVTSGDPDVRIDKPFDAVTSASEVNRVAPVSDEIVEKIGRILAMHR